MKLLLTSLLILSVQITQARPEKGLKPEEIRDMIALCCSYTFLDIYGNDAAILPKGYERIFTSEVMGLDNKFQVYKGKGIGVINLRGSTAEMESWLENFYAGMIPAKGTITMSGIRHDYAFAEHDSAAVHSGYAYAIACLAKDILEQIHVLNQHHIYSIYITGHSQGGALAQMLTAYLQNNPLVSDKNIFKTYAFASPMVGDKEFAAEYCQRFCGMSYNIINPADLVPKFPLSYNDSVLFTKKELVQSIMNPKSIDLSKKGFDSFIRMTEGMVKGTVNKMSNSILKEINKTNADVQMPDAVDGVNYFKLNEMVEVPPADYPKMLKDSSILQNDSLMRIYAKDENGELADPALYKKQPIFYQHKPYNYYVSVLKTYFPEQYARLEMKVIPQNL